MESANIGVDYSSTAIYLACTKGTKILDIAKLDLPEDYLGRLVAFSLTKRTLISFHEYETSGKVFIEQPWVNGLHFPRSGLMMARTASFIEVAAMESNMEPVFIHPHKWRSILYGGKKVIDPKNKAIEYVKEHFPDYELPVMGNSGRGKKLDHNIAESICISIAGEIMTNGLSR